MRLEAAPLLPIASAFAMGIAVGPSIDSSVPHLLALATGLLLLSGAALALGLARVAAAGLVLAVAALGALRAAGPSLPADHIARQAVPTPVALEGRLLEEPVRWSIDRTRILLAVDGYHDGGERRSASGRIQLTIYGETEPLGEGQRIRAEVRLHRPVGFRNPGGFDYPAALRRDGILLVGNGRGDRVVALTPDAPPWPARVKRWAVATIGAHLPETSAALLSGLLLGERTALPREADEAFRRAGVYHILAVSGFNVALLASSVFAVLTVLGVPRRTTALAAAAVLVGFALVVGGHPSVLRATAMGLLLLAAVLLDRRSQLLNAICLAGIALLAWNPFALWDPGFQLSFAATVGIVYLVPAITAFLGEHDWPRWLAAAVAVSLAAQLAVSPAMLAHFNQLSLIGVLANLLVVPLAGPATTIGMLALLVASVSDVAAGLLFDVLWLVLLALRAVVRLAAAVPHAMVYLPAPPWVSIAGWCGGLALLPFLAGRRWAKLSAAALLALAVAVAAWPWLAPGDGRLRITFLDVGQGDATLVEIPDGPRLLIDGGPGGFLRFDVGEHVLSPFLWNRPVGRLDVVALTHADSDHAGGLAAVLRRFRVGEFWETGRWGPGGEATRAALERSAVPRRMLLAGQRLLLGDARVTVMNPGREPSLAANDDSLVLRLDWRASSVLLTGDVGWAAESRMLERGGPGRVVLLRVAHHGSRTSSSQAFLEATRPALAVVSVGARNPFRHPTPETLARLEAVGARVYRTDRDGAIIMETDGAKLWITRWAPRTTEEFDLQPQPLPDPLSLPGRRPG